MDKLIINLKVPAICEQYEIWIPISIKIDDLVKLLAESVRELSKERYICTNEELLCFERKKIVLAGNKMLREYGLKNGDCLIMM